MATPPFTLNITIPGDTDIVSQFPAVDRTHLDILNSWLKTDHNVNGTHNYTTFLQVGVADSGGSTAAAPTVANSNTAIYRDTDGALKMKRGEDSTVEFLGGVPPGVFVAYAGATLPTGWLWCDGSAVNRTTYARLFTAIGTVYGVGDGSTTFNVPDMNARIVLGRDRTGTGRVTTAGSSIDGTTLAANGGVQNLVLLQTHLPNVTFVTTITDPGHHHQMKRQGVFADGSSPAVTANGSGTVGSGFTETSTTGITASTASGGSDLAHTNMPPVLVANYIIRI